MGEPIAVYRESRLELHRRFTLYPGRIRVAGRGLKFGRFDEVVPLSILHPELSRVWLRGLLFRYGIIAMACAVTWAVVALAFGGPAIFFFRPWTDGVLGGLALVGAVLALVHARPIEFVRFRTDSGLSPLDVGRVGPDAESFDEFVDLLVAEIQEARAAAAQSAEPDRAARSDRHSRGPIFEPRLYGTWRSDAAATLDHLRNEPRCPEKALAKLASIVGKLRITFGPDTVTFENCELDGTYTYRVVKSSSESVITEITSDNYRGQQRQSTITFAEDGFWVNGPDPRLPWFREKFVRASETAIRPAEPGSAAGRPGIG